MNIFYLLCFIIMFVSLFLYKKDDKHHNGILWIIIDFIFTFIINSFIVFIYTKLNIKATLFLRGITFLLMSVPMIVLSINKKETQKYLWPTKDIFMMIILLIITSLIAVSRFNYELDLYFETTDPAAHYLMADRFAKSNVLLEKSEADFYYGGGENSTMFFSYTSLGTIFQMCNGDKILQVKSFLIFEIIILFLSGALVYFSIKNFSKKMNALQYISVIFVLILYMFSYPYNNLIFGFHYLGIAIVLALSLFNIIVIKYDKKIHVLDILLMCSYALSIFTTYYMFVPIIYGASGMYMLYKCKIEKKENFKKTAKRIFIILVIPFILGMYYYFLRNALLNNSSGSDSINPFILEGYIYRNLIGNFIIILPFVFYKLFYNFNKKRTNIFDWAFIFNFIFIIILAILLYNDKIASYYFYKLYYIICPFIYIIFGSMLVEDNKETRGISNSILILLICLFLAQKTNIDNKLYYENPLMNNTTFVHGITDIYWFNNTKSKNELTNYIFKTDELNDIIKITNKYKKTLNKEGVIYYDGLLQKLWFYSITKINPNGKLNQLGAFYEENPTPVELYKNNNLQYVIIKITDEDLYNDKQFKIIYETNNYLLLKKINNK